MSRRKETKPPAPKSDSPITCPECGKVAVDWRGRLVQYPSPGWWVECLTRVGGCGHGWYVIDIPLPNQEKPRPKEARSKEAGAAAVHQGEDGTVTIDVQEAMLTGNFEGAFLDAFALSLGLPEEKGDISQEDKREDSRAKETE